VSVSLRDGALRKFGGENFVHEFGVAGIVLEVKIFIEDNGLG